MKIVKYLEESVFLIKRVSKKKRKKKDQRTKTSISYHVIRYIKIYYEIY